MKKILAGLALLGAVASADASVVRLDESAFTASAGKITFSEFAVGTVNPIYRPGDYGAAAGAATVTFGGFFTGQRLSSQPHIDCPNAAPTACIVGTPTGSLSLDSNAPATKIESDGANPSSPVLSGTPTFNGGIAVLFDVDQVGVGFDGGYFNAIGSTAITAFDRTGAIIGSVANTKEGIEFLGLLTADGSAKIAGVFLDLVGNEPAGFAIDNLRFAQTGDQLVQVSEPSLLALFGLGVLFVARRRVK